MSCQVHPSEYAYAQHSVNEAESVGANCRRYPSGPPAGVFTDQFIHCDGSQLILTDSYYGPDQYTNNTCYTWDVGRDGQLLFTYPTRVSLTSITLHYYSDSDRGLPRLRFYAVPDDFNVWAAPTTSNPRVDIASVPPGRQPAGRMNVDINVNFNTKKVLMYKYSSSYQFAVSEVEFFTCEGIKVSLQIIDDQFPMLFPS